MIECMLYTKKSANAKFEGLIPNNELINYSDLASLVGLTAGTTINASAPWMKFNADGVNYFIPQKPVRTNLNWNNLNTVGLVFGKVISIQGKNYLIRLMTGATTDPGNIPGGEWDKFMYELEFSDAELGLDSTVNLQGRANYVKETHTNGSQYCVNRGYTGKTGLSYSTKSIANSNAGWRPILIEQ